MDISQEILSDITVHMKYAKYIPELQRREGLFITFQDVNGNWQFYQFRGILEEFSEKDKWFNLDFEEDLKETLIPITNIEIDNLSK